MLSGCKGAVRPGPKQTWISYYTSLQRKNDLLYEICPSVKSIHLQFQFRIGPFFWIIQSMTVARWDFRNSWNGCMSMVSSQLGVSHATLGKAAEKNWTFSEENCKVWKYFGTEFHIISNFSHGTKLKWHVLYARKNSIHLGCWYTRYYV